MDAEPWKSQLESLGNLIRSQRKLAQLSLRELAERTNVSNPYLSQIERGLHEPSVRVLRSIARVGLEVEKVLGSAQDIEGAVAGGQYYVVQTRPQVGLFKDEA